MQPEPERIVRKPLRVVIADDSEKIRQSLGAMIRCLPHLVVVGQACDGKEALDLIRDTRPDLVILDVDMPEMSGLAVLEAMKGEGLHSKVIMFTGQTEADYRQKCFDLGAAHFFEKASQF